MIGRRAAQTPARGSAVRLASAARYVRAVGRMAKVLALRGKYGKRREPWKIQSARNQRTVVQPRPPHGCFVMLLALPTHGWFRRSPAVTRAAGKRTMHRPAPTVMSRSVPAAFVPCSRQPMCGRTPPSSGFKRPSAAASFLADSLEATARPSLLIRAELRVILIVPAVYLR